LRLLRSIMIQPALMPGELPRGWFEPIFIIFHPPSPEKS